jgi:predicted metalloprotease with PDZ domain
MHVDTADARDSTGRALPDLRLYIDFTRSLPPLRLVLPDSSTAWARAGVRTGDELTAVNGRAVASYGDLRAVLQTLHVGDSAAVDIRRDGQPIRIAIRTASYVRPRVRIVDANVVTREQRMRRERWLSGW